MTIKELYSKNKDVLSYVFFGALTTLINVVCYHLLFTVLKVPNTVSVVISWVLSVAFAFITNKLFVFESKTWERKTALKELKSFVLCRVGTGVLELVLMFALVDVLKFNGTFMKIITNVIVIVLNYIASKFLIFKK